MCDVVWQLAIVVAYLHKNNIVHRDVKETPDRYPFIFRINHSAIQSQSPDAAASNTSFVCRSSTLKAFCRNLRQVENLMLKNEQGVADEIFLIDFGMAG